jgi:uncharacterized protein (TIGR02466 family)
MRSIELFPVTVFKGQVSNNEILKNLLVSEILNESKDLEIPEDWTTHKVRTSFSTQSNILNRTELTSQYIDCMRDVFDKDFDVLINKIWYNVYTDGEYQEVHDHLGSLFEPSHFSFIHFLCFDKENHNPPEFRDPLSQLRTTSLELERNNCGEVYVPDVKEGDLIMFPSYLQHCVPPGKKTEYPRITISFNVKVQHYGASS